MITCTECPIDLENLSEQHGITILYACESGSRAWGIQSINSDYDVRFIYHRPIEEYLRLAPRKDTIEHLEGELDVVGWDLLKTCQLFTKSNPSIIEWLHSPIVYYEDVNFTTALRQIMSNYSPRALMYHYVNLANNQVKEYWKLNEDVMLKKYFYAIRPLLAVLWMRDNRYTIPPLKFTKLFREVSVEPKVKENILELVALKAKGLEKAQGRWKVLDHFIDDYIPICRNFAQEAYVHEPDREALQNLFQQFVLLQHSVDPFELSTLEDPSSPEKYKLVLA